jgi:hypothetical protein
LDLPSALTPPLAAVGIWVAVASGRVWTGIVPGLLAAAFAAGDYALWLRRGKPWHDAAVIALLLPVVACGVWIGVGGTLAGVDRSRAGLLLLEIGPGLALTGLACTLVSYHGRHRPPPAAP